MAQSSGRVTRICHTLSPKLAVLRLSLSAIHGGDEVGECVNLDPLGLSKCFNRWTCIGAKLTSLPIVACQQMNLQHLSIYTDFSITAITEDR